ncbi:putative lipoprotein, rSAM/lipoprotein system [Anaerohalosphaera lusitana]|uniref:Putative lipoprotein, rSAM/lipoprotein system n=1 Tax=Anaerohalosphaera lusitana TaxID=1936003 RepID=A0A1U9NQ91_9BACT|nr:carboxypeptidase-like regulatory domain-containing protein [Anaerohalosphaera lusitana]AQT69985.1 putative lipoprotein, rSAM/lipoprotein system [Anaerohalosphaera lusitana]
MSKLSNDEKGEFFKFRDYVRLAPYHSSTDVSKKVYVDIHNNNAHFEITNYYGHELQIEIGDFSHTIDIDEDDLSDVVINIPTPESFETRKVTFEFVPASPSQPIPDSGKFKVTYKKLPSARYAHSETLDIKTGTAQIKIPTPNRISWQPTKDTNFFFYRDSAKINSASSTIQTIKCYPAGAIFGKFKNTSPNQTRANLGIHVIERSPALPDNRHQTPIVNLNGSVGSIDLRTEGSYYIGPVPLDGEYGITVTVGNYYWLTDPIKLTPKRSICEYDITIPQNAVDLKGTLLDTRRNPITDATISLHIDAPFGGRTHSYGDTIETDQKGRFTIPSVNPDPKLEYSITFTAPGYVKTKHELTPTAHNKLTLEPALTVTGTVIDKKTGKPKPNIRINFWPTTGRDANLKLFEVTTDSNGRFTASQFANTTYNYRLEKDYSYSSKNTGKINPAKTPNTKLYWNP